MNDRQSMSSYDPSRLNSYNPNPNSASSYNPNTASSYNPNTAGSYNPNAASSYNPNPAAAFGSAQPQTGGYDPSRLVKDTSGSNFGYTDGAAFAQPAEQGEKPNSAKAVLFVVGFMVGIVGLVIASQINPALCISVFGAIFAFFGFMAMGGSKKKYPEDKMTLWSCALGGLLVFALPLFMMFLKRSGMSAERFETLRNAMISAAFAAIGLAVLIFPAVGRSMKKRRCTFSVEATCVGLNSKLSNSGSHRRGHHHRRQRLYAPIWEYFFDGRMIRKAETTYSNVNVPQVGDICELMVNPNDPEDVYRHDGGAIVVTTIVGLVFAAMGLLAVFISLK